MTRLPDDLILSLLRAMKRHGENAVTAKEWATESGKSVATIRRLMSKGVSPLILTDVWRDSDGKPSVYGSTRKQTGVTLSPLAIIDFLGGEI